MSDPSEPNPYALTAAAIKDPPTRFRDRLRYLGPGFVLSASIVGSGELVATTVLGAKAGFACLWVILVSCLVKVTVQLEFGKHAINTGESTMAALNHLPGPKLGKANWSIWMWLLLMIAKFLQVGGIIGMVAVICHIVVNGGQLEGAIPQVNLVMWTAAAAIVVALMIFRGYYQFIEKSTLIMIGLFTIFTLVCVGFLQSDPATAIGWGEISSGLTFHIPAGAAVVALGAFGITGVGGDEIMAYNYWLIEKGYAANTGPKENSAEWSRRAKGWIRVMYLDAWFSMAVYTLVTAAFYVLGAAILHNPAIPIGQVTFGNEELITKLSAMYTETVGPGAKWIFLLGSFIVLFSTLFSALAAWTRLFTDAFAQIGWLDFNDTRSRRKCIAILAWIIPFLWGLVYLMIKAPAQMIVIGGLATLVILLIVVFAALNFRYRRLDHSLRPTKFYDIALWLSAASIAAVGVLGLVKNLEEYQAKQQAAPPEAAEAE